MASFNYNPIASYLTLSFTCPNCKEENETDALEVPSPDFSAETSHDSTNDESFTHCCPSCGEEFTIDLYTSFYDGYGEIDLVDESGVIVNEEFEEEYDDSDFTSQYVNEHLQQTQKALEGIEVLNDENKAVLYRTLYANVISCMEGYLSSRLIGWVLSSENNKRKFVESFRDFKECSVPLSNCYKEIESIDNRIVSSLREVIYHNLGRVSGIYKGIGIEIGEITDIMKCVGIRHDIVHRNGKDKKGVLHVITKDDVNDLIQMISTFIDNIDSQFLRQEFQDDSEEDGIELPF